MPYEISQQDIVKIKVDAIVNPTDKFFSGSGRTDAQVHFAAGPELRAACDALPIFSLEGQVAVTEGYRLPCKYIIHTFEPVWQGGESFELSKLVVCYQNALDAAIKLGCESIAFPLISSDKLGFPKDEIIMIALQTITYFLRCNEIMVYLLMHDKTDYEINYDFDTGIRDYIRGIAHHYKHGFEPPTEMALKEYWYKAYRLEDSINEYKNHLREYVRPSILLSDSSSDEDLTPFYDRIIEKEYTHFNTYNFYEPYMQSKSFSPSLEALFAVKHESFSEALLHLITESGMTDAECYKRANISKQHFSKIRSNMHYQPTKQTVFAFAIVLRLTLEDTEQLLKKAGLALNPSDRTDIIFKFFIERKLYSLELINQVLFQYDQKCLGNVVA